MSIDLMDLVAKAIVRVTFALPGSLRNRIILAALYRGFPPKGFR
jgi:hypothetical protein